MARLNSTGLIGFAAAVVLTFGAGQDARAGPITATYLAAGAQSPTPATLCGSATSCFYGTETFSGWAGGNFKSSFNTGASNFNATTFIKGDYGANGDTNWKKVAADVYGGANGTAPYPVVSGGTAPGSAYSVKFTSSADILGINYFGLWISALDASNNLQFYNKGQLLQTFASTDLQAALGACSTAGGYCGNPTTPFKGQNASEQYAYVNFFNTVGYFDQVLLFSTAAGFESSNHSVAYINPLTISGTTFNAPDRPPSAAFAAKVAILVPEPATVMLVFTALVVLLFRFQRRRAAQAAAEPAPDAKKHRRRRSRSRSRSAQFGWPAGPSSRFSA